MSAKVLAPADRTAAPISGVISDDRCITFDRRCCVSCGVNDAEAVRTAPGHTRASGNPGRFIPCHPSRPCPALWAATRGAMQNRHAVRSDVPTTSSHARHSWRGHRLVAEWLAWFTHVTLWRVSRITVLACLYG